MIVVGRVHICVDRKDLHVEQQGHELGYLHLYTSILCISVHYAAFVVGFDQSAYAFNEAASTGQVCITFTGELAATLSLSLGLMLVEESADGTFFDRLQYP